MCYMRYERGGPFPGLYLFTQGARMVRPVRQIASKKTEMVGTLEQSIMHIKCAFFACPHGIVCVSSMHMQPALKLRYSGAPWEPDGGAGDAVAQITDFQ